MCSVTNYAVSSSIRKAAAYLEVGELLDADQLAKAGDSLVMRFDKEFVPPKKWVAAVTALYSSMSYHIEEVIRHSFEFELVRDDDVNGWLKPWNEDHFKPHGWVHRIANSMMALRRQDSGDLGDFEHDLIMRAVRGEFSE